MQRVKRTQTRWMTDQERLELYVDVQGPNDCWLWCGSRSVEGYGRIMVRRKTWAAHRWIYELRVGPIPEGLVLDHLCRNTSCVNPAHLEPVTNVSNILRGVGAAAVNSRRDTCVHGHPFDERNTYIRTNGHRACRTCDAVRRGRMPFAGRRIATVAVCPICGENFRPKSVRGSRTKTCSWSCGQRLRYGAIP